MDQLWCVVVLSVVSVMIVSWRLSPVAAEAKWGDDWRRPSLNRSQPSLFEQVCFTLSTSLGGRGRDRHRQRRRNSDIYAHIHTHTYIHTHTHTQETPSLSCIPLPLHAHTPVYLLTVRCRLLIPGSLWPSEYDEFETVDVCMRFLKVIIQTDEQECVQECVLVHV